ncbi:ATP-binding protein [Flavobacterium sp. WC2421]|uniref:AAA family ATPase n=1 Tax=Flavobacterium sp. WC2421 TaxID=3234138 RepID=UPI0034678C63
MAIGIHRSVNLDKAFFNQAEKEIIQNFGLLFEITFAKTHVFKGISYNYVFLKPTDSLREQFRFQNEILLLITNHHDFDNRTFDYVDKLMSDYQNRLDKLCLILISKDNNIKKKVNSLIQQNPDSRIIIPFNYLDFYKNLPEQIINQRLKEYFYGRDLFAFESPLQNDAYFYGRTATVQFFYDKYKSGENSGLFGLRKIGKTSVLYALNRYLNLRNENTVFIDCQEPSFHLRRWYECLEYLINELVQQIQERNDIILDIEFNKNYNEKDASKYFEEDLKKIFNHQNNQRILIIFDEIENITFEISPTKHWREENDFLYFWQSLRAIYQKNQTLFSFVIAGVNPKTIETGTVNGHDNPIYRMITPNYLKLFNHNDVEEMVKNIGNYMGLDFDKEIFTFLTDDFGGHPFLIRQLCSKIHQSLSKQRPLKVTKLYYKEKIQDFNKGLIDYVEVIVDVLKKWYPNEYELLEALVLDNREKFEEITSFSEQPIIHLLGYNLIEKSDTNKYHIKINAVRDYVIEKSINKRKIVTVEDKWELVTNRRNQLELKIREIIKLNIKSKFGAKAKDHFLKCIEERRREKLNQLNLNDIFSDKGEIYLLDLKVYITKNWSDFENIYLDKPKFEMYLDIVNTNRIDAHAKDLNNEDLTITISALNWLNDKSDKYLE